MNHTIPTFITQPQEKPCQCAITAWEYATGIPRNEIATDLGHDGCLRATDSADRIAAGTATTSDLLGFVGVHDPEMLWWAYNRGINVVALTPLEVLLREMPRERHHDRLHCPRQEELLQLIDSRVAVLSIVLDDAKRIAHSLAWVDKYALDPAVPGLLQPSTLQPEQILKVFLLPDVSAKSRLASLTQPQLLES
jgi:hypothetical protein